MKTNPLYFSGQRWPLAHVGQAADPADPLGRFSIVAGGKSQSWQERKPRGFWRSFPHYCESAATGALFVQRYDDPQSRLSDELQTTWNDEWRTYAATFAGIGKAWLREDDAGISYFGRPEGLAMSDQVVAHMRQVLGEHGVTGQWDAKLGFVPRPKRLLDYMLLSALDAHRRQVPMRKCVECSDFFELHRDHGILCSDQCRLARYAKTSITREQPHGLR